MEWVWYGREDRGYIGTIAPDQYSLTFWESRTAPASALLFTVVGTASGLRSSSLGWQGMEMELCSLIPKLEVGLGLVRRSAL